MLEKIKFKNFNNMATGRVMFQKNNYCVVISKNPYGSHNPVLVWNNDGEYTAIAHGTLGVLNALPNKQKKKLIRWIQSHCLLSNGHIFSRNFAGLNLALIARLAEHKAIHEKRIMAERIKRICEQDDSEDEVIEQAIYDDSLLTDDDFLQ